MHSKDTIVFKTNLVIFFLVKVIGSVTSSTICLGDVDNDGEFELCVGSPTGQLSIFKGGLEPNMSKREVRLGYACFEYLVLHPPFLISIIEGYLSFL